MRLTSRGKRRIIIIVVVLGCVAAAGFAFLGVRDAIRQRAALQARDRGMAAYREGKYDAALRDLSTFLSRNPGELEPLLAFADSRARVSDVNNRHLIAAAGYYNAALQLDPNNLEALNQLLKLYRRIGYRTEMTGVAARLLAIDPLHAEASAVQANQAFRDQNYQEMIKIAERMYAAHPEDLSWRTIHIRALQSGGGSEHDIIKVCDQWIDAGQGDPKLRLFKSQVLANLGRLPEARVEMSKALEREVDSAPLLQSMISTLEQLDMHAEADALISRSKDRFKSLPWVYEASIRRHWQSSRLADAKAELEAAERTIGGQHLSLLKWRALLLASGSDVSQVHGAIEQLRAAAQSAAPVERDSALAWADAIAARTHGIQSNWLGAIEAYERALELQVKDAVLQFMLAEAYSRIGEHDMALALLEQAVSADPNWLAARMARAETLLVLGRAPEAFGEVASVIKGASNTSPAMFLLLCRAWLDGGASDDLYLLDEKTQQRHDLLSLLRSLKQEIGWNRAAVRMLAEACLRRKKSDEAVALINEAIGDRAADAAVLLELAEVSDHWNLGHEQRLIDAARARGGVTQAVVSAQASLHQKQGQLDQSVAVIQDAMKNDPALADSFELRWQAAALLLEQGKPEGAQQIVQLISAASRPGPLFSLLDSERAWNDPNIMRAAIDRLKLMVGDRSARVQLAEANYIYRFRQDDPQAVVQALEVVNDVLAGNPNLKPALALAASLQLVGDNPNPEEAIRNLKRAVDLDPADAGLMQRLVSMLQERGDFESVREYTDRAASSADGKPELCRAQSQLLEAQGDFQRAAARLDMIPENQATEADRIRMALLFTRAGDGERARQIIDELIAAPDASAEAIVAAAEYQAQAGKLAEALALLDARLGENHNTQRQLHRGRLLLSAGQFQDAEAALQDAARLDPANVQSWNELTKLFAATGRFTQARDAAMQALRIEPRNITAKSMLAMVGFSLSEQDRQKTLAMLDELREQNPVLEQTLRLYSALNNPKESDLADAQKLARENPRMAPVWRLAVTLHAQARKWEEAIRLAKQAAAWLPADPQPAELATRLLIQVGRTDEALQMARSWRRLTLAAPLPADTVIAALTLDLANSEEAAKQLAPHLPMMLADPDRHAEPLELWLLAALQTQEAEQAMQQMQALAARPAWRVRLLSMAGKLDQQRAEQVIALVEPKVSGQSEKVELAVALNTLARRFDSTEAYDRAERIAQTIDGGPGEKLAALVIRATVASGLENLELAEQLYRQAMTLNAEHPVVLNNLAEVLVRKARGANGPGSMCEEAVKLAQRAAELSHNDPSVLDTLAQALLCAGKRDDAERQIRQSLESQPRDPSFLLTLARIKHAQGQPGEAQRALYEADKSISMIRHADADLQRRAMEVKQLLGR